MSISDAVEGAGEPAALRALRDMCDLGPFPPARAASTHTEKIAYLANAMH
jgi:hypothetical protein